MSNVKPGDLAKVLPIKGNGGLAGAMVSVIAPYEPRSFLDQAYTEAAIRKFGGPVWLVRIMESRHSADYGVIRAGEEFGCCDSGLKRIDPPEEPDELFSTEPTEAEKQALLRQMWEGIKDVC